MKKNISFQFPIEKQDYTELFRYMPYFKSIFKMATVGNLVALFLFCGYNIIANLQIAQDGTQFLILNIVTVVIGIVMYYVILFLIRLFFRKIIENRSNKLHSLYFDSNSNYLIGYDPRFDSFILGKEKMKIPADQSLTVIETERNLLFYVGKGKGKDDKFLVSKSGSSSDHQLKLERITNMLQEKGIAVQTAKPI
ncbi:MULTISPECIES: hypothetical protein [Bacillaceae]|uniref:YcxB-like protein domain-containing protein n=1 Tax=Sutcliffiella horikoshii TaxID=79883 RepID=A0A5D4T9T1_9BACI|nr:MULTISPECIES: hypothetical protein [Bacillaceae]TYS71965.1 hypothetical protein FZC75_12500 [Sutcliffiella horikoshii]